MKFNVLVTLIAFLFLCGCNNETTIKETLVEEIEEISTEYSEEYLKGQEKASELIEEMESIDWEQN